MSAGRDYDRSIAEMMRWERVENGREWTTGTEQRMHAAINQ